MNEREYTEKYKKSATKTVWECEMPKIYYEPDYVYELKEELAKMYTENSVLREILVNKGIENIEEEIIKLVKNTLAERKFQ